jgi:hypothetical protein
LEVLVKKLLLTGIAVPLLLPGAAQAEISPEKCSCEGRECSFACISEPTPEVVAALRKRFPDLDEKDIQVFDDRQVVDMPSPYHVAFFLKDKYGTHMACRLWLNPIRLRSCRIIHA